MGNTMVFTGSLVVIGGCWNCGCNCAIPETLYREARDNGRTFWCPACGESQVYGTTEVQRLRAELAREEGRTAMYRADAKLAENRRRAERAAKTKLKNRIAAGVCPCCNRHFANVQNHIENQHPEFAEKGE